MEEDQRNENLPQNKNRKISRRSFLKLAAGTAASLAIPRLFPGLIPQENRSENSAEAQLLRKEHFKPFNRGNVEWQYVEFQYKDTQNQHIGITTSIGEITNPYNGQKMQSLLVVRHNLDTGETIKNIYSGARSFDEATSTYTFTNTAGKLLTRFSYEDTKDKYLFKVNTGEFNSDEIDSNGLILNPQGNLIPVSKDGNFPIASYNGGKIITNYYADHVRLEKQNGEIVGYGRRDSENLEVTGTMPSANLDIDHTWVHASGERIDGKQFFITGWQSKTGGNFRFADILLIDPNTGKQENFTQLNEEDPDFNISFTPALTEQETPPNQTGQKKYQMAHGGKVVSSLKGQALFELNIDGNPGQIIDSKGFMSMIEAHGRLTSGSVLGVAVKNSNSAIWETTEERYSTFLPLTVKQ